MSMSMSIANLSSAMSQSQLHTQVAFSVVDKAMDTAEQQGNQLVQQLQAMATGLGNNLDVRA